LPIPLAGSARFVATVRGGRDGTRRDGKVVHASRAFSASAVDPETKPESQQVARRETCKCVRARSALRTAFEWRATETVFPTGRAA